MIRSHYTCGSRFSNKEVKFTTFTTRAAMLNFFSFYLYFPSFLYFCVKIKNMSCCFWFICFVLIFETGSRYTTWNLLVDHDVIKLKSVATGCDTVSI